MIVNNDGDNGPGGHHVHYGQQAHSQQPDDRQQMHQQGQQSHAVANPTPYGGSIMMNKNGGPTRQDGDHIPRAMAVQPNTPLFERLVTEEVQELKAYARIIESQNRRLAELERVHGDLEARLEQESSAKLQLESTLEERERLWNEKFNALLKDRDHWKEVVQIEQNKNSRLIEQVVRKDQDIQKMLQRKYDQPREGGHFNHQSTRTSFRPQSQERERSGTPNASSRSPSMDQHKSPYEVLAANGSAEAVRVRNVAHTLLDFFNMR